MEDAQNHSFLSNCTSGGCGAKMGPGELSGILQNLPKTATKDLLVGFDASDDAAVYKINKTDCIISTADFFSPMVEDPKTFGRIAAANALSDVWAMGGTPIMALNLTCFPEKMDLTILGKILEGGAEKIAEAGAVLGGGHTIYDREPKYGLAVTGQVKAAAIIRNNTPNIGDSLILTKPLGIGIVMAATRGEQAKPAHTAAAIHGMQHLNKYAAEKMGHFPVSACTDVTGFGLLGHASEMAGNTCSLQLHTENLPALPGAVEYANEYLLTAAGQRNRNFLAKKCDVSTLPFAIQELLFDPQTSGGLLISVPEAYASALLKEIHQDDPSAAIIGQVTQKQQYPITFV